MLPESKRSFFDLSNQKNQLKQCLMVSLGALWCLLMSYGVSRRQKTFFIFFEHSSKNKKYAAANYQEVFISFYKFLP